MGDGDAKKQDMRATRVLYRDLGSAAYQCVFVIVNGQEVSLTSG